MYADPARQRQWERDYRRRTRAAARREGEYGCVWCPDRFGTYKARSLHERMHRGR